MRHTLLDGPEEYTSRERAIMHIMKEFDMDEDEALDYLLEMEEDAAVMAQMDD